MVTYRLTIPAKSSLSIFQSHDRSPLSAILIHSMFYVIARTRLLAGNHAIWHRYPRLASRLRKRKVEFSESFVILSLLAKIVQSRQACSFLKALIRKYTSRSRGCNQVVTSFVLKKYRRFLSPPPPPLSLLV